MAPHPSRLHTRGVDIHVCVHFIRVSFVTRWFEQYIPPTCYRRQWPRLLYTAIRVLQDAWLGAGYDTEETRI